MSEEALQRYRSICETLDMVTEEGMEECEQVLDHIWYKELTEQERDRLRRNLFHG